MKKTFAFILALLLISILLSCQATDNNNADEIEEFSYLPIYEGMELISVEKAPTDEGMDKGTYKISNTTPEEFLTNYENYLAENGWKKTDDNKPVSINMEKEDHKAIVIIPSVEDGDELTVIVFTV